MGVIQPLLIAQESGRTQSTHETIEIEYSILQIIS